MGLFAYAVMSHYVKPSNVFGVINNEVNMGTKTVINQCNTACDVLIFYKCIRVKQCIARHYDVVGG